MKEINTVMGIGQEHGYGESFLRKLHDKVERSLCKEKTQTIKLNTFRSVDQGLWVENFAKNIIGLTNCTLSFKRNLTVFGLIRNDKHYYEDKDRSGVYSFEEPLIR